MSIPMELRDSLDDLSSHTAISRSALASSLLLPVVDDLLAMINADPSLVAGVAERSRRRRGDSGKSVSGEVDELMRQLAAFRDSL